MRVQSYDILLHRHTVFGRQTLCRKPIPVAVKCLAMKRDSKQRYAEWSDLADIGRQLKQQRQAQARAEKREQQRLARQRAERNLFTQTIARTLGEVRPVKRPPTVSRTASRPDAIPQQTLLDRQRVLAESMGQYGDGADTDEAVSDDWEAAALLSGDEQLRFARPHIPDDVVRRLRRGHWRIQAQLDLHNMQTDTAREAVSAFIRQSHRLGIRCVRVIHGKGYGSEGGVAVLKHKVPRWLMQKKQVLAFVQAREADGGAGAVVVLLCPVT